MGLHLLDCLFAPRLILPSDGGPERCWEAGEVTEHPSPSPDSLASVKKEKNEKVIKNLNNQNMNSLQIKQIL